MSDYGWQILPNISLKDKNRRHAGSAKPSLRRVASMTQRSRCSRTQCRLNRKSARIIIHTSWKKRNSFQRPPITPGQAEYALYRVCVFEIGLQKNQNHREADMKAALLHRRQRSDTGGDK
jgi:hypothetical protein